MKASRSPNTGFLRELARNRPLYLMVLPGALALLVFAYLPMGGLVIAFKNYKLTLGILTSPWIDPIWKNFEFFFTSEYAWRVTRNTLLLNLAFLVSGVVMEAGFALILNEMRIDPLKKTVQSLVFLPYFISWIVVGFFAYSILNYNYGVANRVLRAIGLAPQEWYSNAKFWPAIMVVINRWKATGYGAVIYLAVLTGIDRELYEAAEIDGAGRWAQVRYISIPLMVPTIILLSLLSIGRIMNADFGMFYAVVGENSLLFPTTDVIDTFVYRTLRKLNDYGMASATGFYQSVLSFLLVMGSNWLANRYSADMGLFTFSRRARS